MQEGTKQSECVRAWYGVEAGGGEGGMEHGIASYKDEQRMPDGPSICIVMTD